jgi:hypothetical protein
VGDGRKSRNQLRALAQPDQWTTGYSGSGQQRAYTRAQTGEIRIKDLDGNLLGRGELQNGLALVSLDTLPSDGELKILFGGDTTSSYLVNYRPSSTLVNV